MHTVNHSVNIIELKDICFAYGEQDVLHDVDLAVHKGDYLGIVGPNGGGKTTLLKIMLGLLPTQCGEVKLFGKDLRSFKEWSKIGYVPQKATNFDVNFPVTAKEVVLMGLYAARGVGRGTRNEDRVQADAALDAVGMKEYATHLIGDLSGGQQQRVFIARALAGDPEVLILDEPTAGVDEAAQRDFYALLQKLNHENHLTLILVSHDSEVLEKEAMEIATVNRGVRYERNY